MDLYIVRHARSAHNEWVIRKIFRPWLWGAGDLQEKDVELSSKGILQAKRLEEEVNKLSLDLVICSPLTRAIQTMELAVGDRKVHVICTPLIRERCDRIADTGSTLSFLTKKYPNFEFMHFNGENWWESEEFPNGFKESEESVRRRIWEFKEFLKTRKEKNVLVVSHGYFIKFLLNQMLMNMNCQISYTTLEKIC